VFLGKHGSVLPRCYPARKVGFGATPVLPAGERPCHPSHTAYTVCRNRTVPTYSGAVTVGMFSMPSTGRQPCRRAHRSRGLRADDMRSRRAVIC